jgi:hypothetical protein
MSHGFVHVPNQDLWPSGMYARDMGLGLDEAQRVKEQHRDTLSCSIPWCAVHQTHLLSTERRVLQIYNKGDSAVSSSYAWGEWPVGELVGCFIRVEDSGRTSW